MGWKLSQQKQIEDLKSFINSIFNNEKMLLSKKLFLD